MKFLMELAEWGRIPDPLIRLSIRALNQRRLMKEARRERAAPEEYLGRFLAELRQGPIAMATQAANEQHYEVPPEFFELVLGKRLKYSCCHWPAGVETLDQAEEAMLALSAARAELVDGQDILDLGCGWGSWTLWAAEHFPGARILAVSNSRPQGDFIRTQAAHRGLQQVEVVSSDMNDFSPDRTFDRIVSVEMFEHLRNWPKFLKRVSAWLKPGGKLFIHVFSHRRFAYRFETDGPGDWLGRTFFTGGMMPSDDLLLHCQEELVVEGHWRLNGRHYQKTAEAWLANLDARRAEVLEIFRGCYGRETAKRWVQRWRLFFLACSELWGCHRGEEWLVSHYRLRGRG